MFKEIVIPRAYVPFIIIFLAVTYIISFFLIRSVMNYPAYCFSTCKKVCPVPLARWNYNQFEALFGGYSLNITEKDFLANNCSIVIVNNTSLDVVCKEPF